jgi:hypothetical protein
MTLEKVHIVALDSRKIHIRIILIVAVLLAVVFGWYSVRWQLGHMLADLTLPTDKKAQEAASAALNLSPGDPATNWFAASILQRPEDAEAAIKGYENAVRLAPYDFTYWIELGRAYEQGGRDQDAEKALLHAVELAPNYTFPHWQLGNFYLRRHEDVEAFAELKKAAENNVVYREQVFSIAWDYYEQDTAKVEELAGNTASTKASLAKFYAVKERPNDSLRAWNSLSDEEKQQQQEIAKLIAQAFYDKRFYRSSVQFVRQLGIEPDAQIGTIGNAGFENSLNNESGRVYFSWKTLPLDKVEIKTDPNLKHEGNRSLRILFTGFSGIELSNIYQIAAVESPAQYRLSFWLRTENLKSAGPPTLEILNANDDKILASGKPFPVGSNDWQEVEIEFAAPENAEAVNIRTARVYCGNGCPIVGTIWLDDFKLEKIN